MPTRIVPILDRLRQDIAAVLSESAIREACHQVHYRWRDRRLGPATTIYLFLLQVLHGNTACQHVVHFGGRRFRDTAYCQARQRLPLAVFQQLLQQTAEALRATTAETSRWLGHRVWMADGSGFSMPDTPELQDHFGQPTGQRPGCGFPLAKWLALFDLTTGMLLRSATAPLRRHEMTQAATLSDDLQPGDVVLGDRGFCSYAHMAILSQRQLHAVFRVHQKQLVDFTPGRPHAGPGVPKSAGMPRSRWVLTQGDFDQVVVWYKPADRPPWLSVAAYAALPSELTVRELRYRIEAPGYRAREVTLVTTLLEASSYPASELADLDDRRWQVEVNFDHIKTTMKMDVLKCKSVDGVLKELAMFCLAYNLVRSVTAESAALQGLSPERISFVDALRWLIGVEPTDLSKLVVNPARRGRVEPRVVKRRPKPYRRMTKPRGTLRKELPKKGL